MNKIFWLIGLLLITSTVLAYDLTDLKTSAVSAIGLEKESFSSNDIIRGSFIVTNTGLTTIVGGTTAIYLEKDGLIIDEQITKNNWIIPTTEKEIDFEFRAQGSGNYIVKAYFWNNLSEAVGKSTTLSGGAFKEFIVTGTEEKKPFLENEVSVNNEILSPKVAPEQAMSIKATVVNPSSKNYSGLIAKAYFCNWATFFCENVPNKEITLSQLSQGATKEITFNLTAPKKPGFYELKVVLTENGEIISLVKTRVELTGKNIEARKLELTIDEELPVKANLFLIGTSNEESTGQVTIITKANGTTIETIEGKEQVLNYGEIVSEEFVLEKDFDEICVRVISGGTIENCFYSPIQEIRSTINAWKEKFTPVVVKAEAIYDSEKESIILSLEKEKINCMITVLSPDSQKLYAEMVGGEGILIKEFYVKRELGKVQIIVDDMDAKKQQVIELKTIDDEYGTEQKCLGVVCAGGLVCEGTSFSTIDGTCCIGKCITQLETSEGVSPIPLIFWGALILFVIALMIGVNSFRGLNKK